MTTNNNNNNGNDLFSNFNTGGSDLFGTAGSQDLFGGNNFPDPFAGVQADLFGTPAPAKEEKNNVVPLKAEEKKTDGKAETKKDDKKAADKKSKEKPKAKKIEEKVVDATWTWAYAAKQGNPTHEMTVEELRETLELDYPELSKDRTRWHADEERKLLVPTVSGAKNG